MGFKLRIKEAIKQIPGVRKLVFFFNEVRRLDSRIAMMDSRIAMMDSRITTIECKLPNELKHRLQLIKEEQNELKAEILDLLQKEPFEGPRLAVYTVLIGDYETLATPFVIERGCDYYCITNNKNLQSSFWKMIYIDNEEDLDNTRLQRKYKINPHLLFPQYEHSLYIDTSVVIRGSAFAWIERNSTGKPWMVYCHPDRDCVYEEAEACKLLRKDSSELIDAQMNRYRSEGYPQNAGMVWNAIIYRKHLDPSVIELENSWFNEITAGSRRDQLSFNYVCWKNDFQYDTCEEDYHISFLWASSHDGIYK